MQKYFLKSWLGIDCWSFHKGTSLDGFYCKKLWSYGALESAFVHQGKFEVANKAPSSKNVMTQKGQQQKLFPVRISVTQHCVTAKSVPWHCFQRPAGKGSSQRWLCTACQWEEWFGRQYMLELTERWQHIPVGGVFLKLMCEVQPITAEKGSDYKLSVLNFVLFAYD